MRERHNKAEDKSDNMLESLELWRQLIDNSDEIHCFYDSDERLIYVNPAFQVITGYSTQELYKRGFIFFVHPDDAQYVTEYWQRIIKGEIFGDIECRVLNKSGRIQWVLCACKRIYDSSGVLIGLQIKIQDITKQKGLERQLKDSEIQNHYLLEESGRKQVEQALKEERDKAQRYLDTVEAIIVALDTRGNINLVNRKGCEVLGYEEQEILGKNWFDTFIPRGEIKEVKQVFQDIISGNIGPVEYYENGIMTRDGKEYVIAWHNRILRDSNNNIVGSLGAGNDITKRIQAEQKTLELLQQNRNLTQRLFHVQEQERRHLARELHDENSQWLTALRMHAHVLASHCNNSNPEVKESIKDIEDISSHMQKNIRRMIRKLRAVDFNDIGLKDSLMELVDQWQARFPQTHCTLDVKGIFDNISNTLGITIYRIVQESLTNVAKHAEANNVTIQLLHFESQTPESNYISLRIQDDGKGVTHSNTSEGFGLAGMRERVLAIGGKCAFSDSAGDGMQIDVQLPADAKDRRKGF